MYMLDNLRILYLTADASLYGSNKSLLNLLSSINLNKENYIIVTPKYGDFNKELDRLHIRNYVIKYYWECGFKGNNIFFYLKFAYRYVEKCLVNLKAKPQLIKIVKENRISLIHSNSSVISCGFEVAKKLGIKHVWHIREFIKLDHNLTLYLGEERYFKKIYKSDGIIYVSKSLAGYYKKTKNKGNIIYNAVERKSEIPEPVDKENYFLFCGSVTQSKGLHKALEAFGEVCKTDKKLKLKIAGDFIRHDEYYNHILGLVEKLQLGNNIEFLGYREDARTLMNKATALLVCSRHEGMGRVTAEGMLNNCLVIGYDDKAGTSELIQHKKTGLLFATNEQLVSAMRFSLEEKSAVRQIITKAKEFALNNFIEEVFRTSLLNVYQNLE